MSSTSPYLSLETHSHGTEANGVGDIQDWPDTYICILTVVLIHFIVEIPVNCNITQAWGSNDYFLSNVSPRNCRDQQTMHVATRYGLYKSQ